MHWCNNAFEQGPAENALLKSESPDSTQAMVHLHCTQHYIHTVVIAWAKLLVSNEEFASMDELKTKEGLTEPVAPSQTVRLSPHGLARILETYMCMEEKQTKGMNQ